MPRRVLRRTPSVNMPATNTNATKRPPAPPLIPLALASGLPIVVLVGAFEPVGAPVRVPVAVDERGDPEVVVALGAGSVAVLDGLAGAV